MDDNRFDKLSRKLAHPRSRREALGLLGAAVASLLVGRSADATPDGENPNRGNPDQARPSKCYGGDSHCTNGKQCCSGICTNRQCAPEIPPECTVATDCTSSISDCEVHTCAGGVCGTASLVTGTVCSTGICNGSGQCVECLANSDCASGLCENNICSPTCLTDPMLGAACTAGVGGCLRSGVFVCAPDGLGVVCDAVEGTPSTEICNGIDDDCDGAVDEGAICPPLPNANTTCVGGNCVLTSCQPGFANCNGNSGDGCEKDLRVDPANCGFCGRQCESGPNSSAICVGGNCAITCTPGFFNCNGNPVDGCECPDTAECRSGTCCISSGETAQPNIPCCSGFIIPFTNICGWA